VLTVLSVAFPFAPVSEDSVGGTEQIVARLDAGLVRRGLRSIVVASEGSRVRGTLVPAARIIGLVDERARKEAHARQRQAIAHALQRWPVDLVHLHGLDFAHYLPPPGPPALVTLHLPVGWYPPEALHPSRPRTHLCCVSQSQRATAPPDLALLPDQPNGVPLDELTPRFSKHGFALAIGRICGEKGFHLAAEAAALAGVPLLIAGDLFPYPDHLRYFREQLLPRLGRARLIGPIRGARKRRLLAAARCVLIPSLEAETSSLVAMEALASGTPVIAFRSGALPELIEDGKTGFLAGSVDELARAIARTGELDPRACRAAAEARFSSEAMIDRYLDTYRRLTARPSLAPEVRLDELTSVEALDSIADEWRALAEACPQATPFQRPEWLIPWCRTFGVQPWALALRRHGELIGLAPFRREGAGASRVVSLLGAGITDYLDVLVAPPHGARATAAFFAHLDDQRDRCDFVELRRGSLLLDAPCPADWLEERTPSADCPVLTLPGSLDDLPGVASRRLVASFQQYRRHLMGLGELRLVTAGPDDTDEHLAMLFHLHAQRFSLGGEPGVLDDPIVQRFHREAAPGLCRAGALELHTLELDRRALAVFYGFRDPRSVYLYLCAFDPELDHASLATVLVGLVVERAILTGAAELDFLRGRERYKYRWGARDRPNQRRRLIHRSRVGALLEGHG
jgi:CelD/BcsL family acetyltransferase involved in cellulose biosynthesis/glycosyltransferase involved in cell wall biosynthesis